MPASQTRQLDTSHLDPGQLDTGRLDRLYSSLLLAWAGRSFPLPAPAGVRLAFANPLCGDRGVLALGPPWGTDAAETSSGGASLRLMALGYEVEACLLCRASLAMLVTETRTLRASEAYQKMTHFLDAFHSDASNEDVAEPFEDKQSVRALCQVRAVRMRRRCVTLAFEALQRLLYPFVAETTQTQEAEPTEPTRAAAAAAAGTGTAFFTLTTEA